MTSAREKLPFYIGTSDEDIAQMLDFLGLKSLDDLFSHIPQDCRMTKALEVPPHLQYADLQKHMTEIAGKNRNKLSFIGDGLQRYKVAPAVGPVCNIRGLTTAYTPYQPERSQGTLQSLWIYQSTLAAITGFEAINASLYDRATCLFEALNCGSRIQKKNKVLVASNIYPGDIEVLKTHAIDTTLEIEFLPVDPQTGLLDPNATKLKLTKDVAAIAFPQISTFGHLENFDALTDLAREQGVLSIAIIDPAAIADNGLKEPGHWGRDELGADILVGEGQHLTIDNNFGGPGLGIFGIRFNERTKNYIRMAAGRFIGKASDAQGRECKAIILSTREQHIRREKATSNICSNQSFVASACGAAILNKGSKGLAAAWSTAHAHAMRAAKALTALEGVALKFKSAFYNEFTLKLQKSVKELQQKASEQGIHLGVNISGRCGCGDNLLQLSFNDTHSDADVDKLIAFFKTEFTAGQTQDISEIPASAKRKSPANIPSFSTEELVAYYKKLGKQNLSPDESIYPLGSCTMKYNPEINDWAASLPGFTESHPQAPQDDTQGNLEVLYQIQEQFKAITGLPGCTTQPVAGAQGEFVGLKLFQAYFRDQGDHDRNIVLIPRSAHGTNPATATMAGFDTKKVGDTQYGIVTIEALPTGEMDFEQFKATVQKFGNRIAGIMVTNPNTAGIFETKFKQMSELIHNVGGFVYMDGANMNAIAGHADLGKLGVDAVHNNLHKTWSIPHGGGGPGDAIVAVSEKLIPFLPGHLIAYDGTTYRMEKPSKSIGSIHRHHGNFAHKVRAYTYLRALGPEGIRKMSAVAVLSARYLYKKLRATYPVLPKGSEESPRMHEFILTLEDRIFEKAQSAGIPKAGLIAKVGKLFLDFGFHAPTVAFPEVFGLMIEPTESYSKSELDEFCNVVLGIHKLIEECPEVLGSVPHFTPVDKVDEVSANKTPILSERLTEKLPAVLEDRYDPDKLRHLPLEKTFGLIVEAHRRQSHME